MKKKWIIITIVAVAALYIAASTVTSSRLVSELTVNEQLSTPSIEQNIKHQKLNEVVNFRPTTDTVNSDVDNVFSEIYSSSSGSIDLTSTNNSLGESLDLTGERIMAIKVKAKQTNTGTITFSEGATNGYPLMGAGFTVDLKPNQSLLFKADTALTEVDGSNLQLDYSMTNSNDTLSVLAISANLY